MSIAKWNEAKKALHDARAYIGLIGKAQRTSLRGVGKVHSVGVKTQIYYQETDGAQNYHSCTAFDGAFSVVIMRHWDALKAEALEDLEKTARQEGRNARRSVQSMLNEIDVDIDE